MRRVAYTVFHALAIVSVFGVFVFSGLVYCFDAAADYYSPSTPRGNS